MRHEEEAEERLQVGRSLSLTAEGLWSTLMRECRYAAWVGKG